MTAELETGITRQRPAKYPTNPQLVSDVVPLATRTSDLEVIARQAAAF